MLIAVTLHLPNLRVALAQLLFQRVRPTLDEDPLPGHLVRRRVVAELHGRIDHRRREATVLGALPPLVRLERVLKLRLGDASQRLERLEEFVHQLEIPDVLHRVRALALTEGGRLAQLLLDQLLVDDRRFE